MRLAGQHQAPVTLRPAKRHGIHCKGGLEGKGGGGGVEQGQSVWVRKISLPPILRQDIGCLDRKYYWGNFIVF
jgi:hypothetical protein